MVIPPLRSCVFAGDMLFEASRFANIFGVSAMRVYGWMSGVSVSVPPELDLMYMVSCIKVRW
jgi:hypothetical protein